jgi:hypothetical protein
MACQANAQPRGKYVALIIGNDTYQSVANLKTAVNDARAVEILLRDRYGFETKLLANATRAQIMSALSGYRRTLDADSSLLVYYAGHGYSDPAVDKTYWWPVDAKPDDNSEWISADDITTGVKAVPARHVLIVSDSCYSGTLSRGVTPFRNFTQDTDRALTLKKLSERPSRELFSSGGNEPVADGGAGNHSVFANAFLKALETMEPDNFAVEEIFDGVRESVGGTSGQLPEFGPLRNSGHEGGSFVFSRIAGVLPNSTKVSAPIGGINLPRSQPLVEGYSDAVLRSHATSGTLVWKGRVDGSLMVVVEDNRPSAGVLSGDALPAAALILAPLDRANSTLDSSPGPGNHYRRLVFTATGHGDVTARFKWTLPSK